MSTGIASPLDTEALNDALISHAQALGIFDSVNGHEPRNAPGHGLTFSLWIQTLRPFAPQSGLAATAAAVVYNARIYLKMPGELPGHSLDDMDPRITDAAAAMIGSLSADFTLDGLALPGIDLLGRTGAQFGLGGEAGYLEQDRAIYRVMVLTIPIVLNDIFTQAP